MYGALIGNIVGSRDELGGLKTKSFPLFPQDCTYTDDAIMTAAVAKAITLSIQEHRKTNGHGKAFQKFLVETMQDFGKRYTHPKGGYGANFSAWLQQEYPRPYNSFGNAGAMRVSPCGLIAVSLEEAKALARASASVTHTHPEGIKGAEAVAAAVFMAKNGSAKADIKAYIEKHYYPLNFTLDSIRPAYRFDASCQGTVPQAIAAFLESDSFEDAIRNAVSLGGDTATLGAITGSIAWVYYAVQNGSYEHWKENKFDVSMQNIKAQAMMHLPEEFIEIADAFHAEFLNRANYWREQDTLLVLNRAEVKTYLIDRTPAPEKKPGAETVLDPELEQTIEAFCRKYIVLVELLYLDAELNNWCHKYSAYLENTVHIGLREIIYDTFMKEAYYLDFMPRIMQMVKHEPCPLEKLIAESKLHIAYGIAMEIRSDYHSNGSLIDSSLAQGRLYRLMRAYLNA